MADMHKARNDLQTAMGMFDRLKSRAEHVTPDEIRAMADRGMQAITDAGDALADEPRVPHEEGEFR